MSPYFATREEARQYCRDNGIPQTDIQRNKYAPKGRRWHL